jgi:hypothetical protein
MLETHINFTCPECREAFDFVVDEFFTPMSEFICNCEHTFKVGHAQTYRMYEKMAPPSGVVTKDA